MDDCFTRYRGLVVDRQTLAQDSQTGGSDEKAMAVLKGMSDYLSKEPTISFRARTFFDVVQKGGIKVKTAREVEVVLARPNRIQANSLDDTGAPPPFGMMAQNSPYGGKAPMKS